jgi:hypothetical protein
LCSSLESFFNIGSFGVAEEMIAPAASAMDAARRAPDAIKVVVEP